ncbi:MAG: malto-oligosyltrehalose synthase [Acidobacteria bacterium]|nr:malto-oligosyltrehalose synthase [Acidobacteriota bacterium]
MRPLTATYRLQFHPSFTFADAALILPDLHALGISHAYASPVFEATPGSQHGYDVTDPSRVRVALGGDAGWQALATAADSAGLGLIADIVPNHMAISGNPWWTDVLEHGESSPYRRFFDLGTDTQQTGSNASLVLPVLAAPYGDELAARRLAVVDEHGMLQVAYGEARFPLAGRSLPAEARVAGDARNAFVAAVNDDEERLHTLLEAQSYRLAWWRLARDESPYRRFFDVNGLVGMRVEDAEVFDALHRLPLSWVEQGFVDGLRVDHVDGLVDPAAYLTRLRAAAPDAWIVIEKIVARDEPWRSWPVDGTTGYEFSALTTRLFTAPEGEAPLTTLHDTFTGLSGRFAEVAMDARQEVLSQWLLGDAQRVATVLYDSCQRDRRLRDYSQRDCLSVVQELVARCPVYRTYVTAAGAAEDDARILGEMLAAMEASRPDLPAPLVAYARALCVGPGEPIEFVLRLQQLCTAVAAKAIEDTAFFRDTRSLAHNEVGADPAWFSASPDDFHATIARWQREQPRGLRATSTHDSKRAEDVRLRLTVLSEMPEAWAAQVDQWRAITDTLRIDGWPDANFEYYLYQTLVGGWPLTRERVHQHAEKAVREGKLFSNWATPSEEYERAVHRLVDGLFDSRVFTDSLDAFVATLAPADWHKSLAETLLKVTTPGVADIYQGGTSWLHNLSDPDNRRAVDHATLADRLRACDPSNIAAIMAGVADGLPKLHVLTRSLQMRRTHADLLPEARYEPLEVTGHTPPRAVAFRRGDSLAIVVPIRTLGVNWEDEAVQLPSGRWIDAFTNTEVEGGTVPLSALWRHFPLSLLERQPA